MKTIEEIKISDFVQIEYNDYWTERFNRVSHNAWEMIYDATRINICGGCGGYWDNGCTSCDGMPQIVNDIFVAKKVRVGMLEGRSMYVSSRKK